MNLSELAKQLKVSPATVSRAINRPESVAEETRRRVLQAVATHGYRPDPLARSLRTRRTTTIGLVVSDIRNPFYAAVAKAVEDAVRDRGYSVLVCNADEDPAREAEALALLANQRVSGVIHSPSGANLAALRRLRAQGIPVVDLDRVSGRENADAVLVDNRMGARLAAEHLIGLGHERVATVAGPLHLTTGRDRLEGFRTALEAAGRSLAREHVEVGDFREASGRASALRLLELREPPTAIFVANNEMTAGALAAVRERGVRVPAELSLVSFDDAAWARFVEPPLTVVAQPVEQIGAQAAELLLRQLDRPGESEPTQRILEPRLIMRGSTAAPPAPRPRDP